MVRFEELQELWQSQPQPEIPAIAAESRGMAATLRRFRRQQYVFNGVKLVIIGWLGWFLLPHPRPSLLTVLGDVLLVAGFMTAIVTDWRIQSAIARLDFTRPSLGFVEATLKRLGDPNAAFRRTGWMGIAMVAAGVNLMFASRPAGDALPRRMVSHTAVTLFLFSAFAIGLKVRAKRYTMTYKPLVEKLAAMKAALEERAR